MLASKAIQSLEEVAVAQRCKHLIVGCDSNRWKSFLITHTFCPELQCLLVKVVTWRLPHNHRDIMSIVTFSFLESMLLHRSSYKVQKFHTQTCLCSICCIWNHFCRQDIDKLV